VNAPPSTTAGPGLPAVPIETNGATTLAAVGNRFSLLDNNGVGPSLKDSGGVVVAGEFGAGGNGIGAEDALHRYGHRLEP
jgi:hypothetical protein